MNQSGTLSCALNLLQSTVNLPAHIASLTCSHHTSKINSYVEYTMVFYRPTSSTRPATISKRLKAWFSIRKPSKQPFVIKVSYTTPLMFLLLAQNTSSQSTGTSPLPPITQGTRDSCRNYATQQLPPKIPPHNLTSIPRQWSKHLLSWSQTHEEAGS